MEYVIASTAVIDEIEFENSEQVKKVAGGAGIYALCGVKLWSDSVVLATGVGEDYGELFGPWYEKNGITTEGLIVKDARTPRNRIRYFQDGERSETPLYGADHYKKIAVTPEELEPYFKTAKGIYIFKNSDPEFWGPVLRMAEGSDAAVLWEIAADAAIPEKLEDVKRIAEKIDIFSVNLTESRRMLGVSTLEEAVAGLRTWGIKLIFLRNGSAGAVMITPEATVFVPPVKGIRVEDPTGGGNSSSGAVLCGYCSGRDPMECGLMGSISAAVCIGQYGVPDDLGLKARENACRALEKMRGRETDEK